MRRLDTDHLRLYYPEHRRNDALELAAKLEDCLSKLDALRPEGAPRDRGRAQVVMPEVEFNNAYVQPPVGGMPNHMVIPTHFTSGFFTELGMGPSPGLIGCHEAVHYVQASRFRGLPRILRAAFGDLYTPQIGLDPWFWEGLATYYESKLAPGTGRMASPAWRGMFASGIAEERIRPGAWLHAFNPEIPHGGYYLVGSHFVEYLADAYGEETLWQLVERQGKAIAFPLLVNHRFRKVYGKSLSALMEEFFEHAKTSHPPRDRPDTQKKLRHLGRSASLEIGPDGSTAILAAALDEPPRLTVLGPDGATRFDRELPDLLPPRTIALGALDGMRFGPEDTLYVTSFDVGRDELKTHLLAIDLDSGRIRVAHRDLGGSPGDVTPDGERYVFPLADGNRHHLASLDLNSGEVEILHRFGQSEYVASPRISPDGEHIAALIWRDHKPQIWLMSKRGEPLRLLSEPTGRHLDPSWLDDRHVVYLAEREGRFQAVAQPIDGGETWPLTDAPYLVRHPQAAGPDRLRVVNLEGWEWTLDEVVYPAELRASMERPEAEPVPANGRAGSALAFAGTGVARMAAARGAAASGERERGGDADAERPHPARPEVHSDRPYSRLDGLFFPRGRFPFVDWSSHRGLETSLSLMGSDRLGFHNWGANVAYAARTDRWDLDLSYVNMELAPWMIGVGGRQQWSLLLDEGPDPDDGLVQVGEERLRSAQVGLLRTFYTVPLLFELQGHELLRLDDRDGSEQTRRFVGGAVQSGYLAGRGSAHGAPTFLALDGSVGAFPEVVGSDFDVYDVGAGLELGMPLPLSRRHGLVLGGTGRYVVTGDGSSLLRLGGTGGGRIYAAGSADRREVPSDVLVPQLRFQQHLRGFEDLGLLDRGVVVLDGAYSYRLPIDWGTASTLYALPSFYASALRAETFGMFAHTASGNRHAAVGGAITFETVLWSLPVPLRYQLSRRLTDDEALVHTIGLGGF